MAVYPKAIGDGLEQVCRVKPSCFAGGERGSLPTETVYVEIQWGPRNICIICKYLLFGFGFEVEKTVQYTVYPLPLAVCFPLACYPCFAMDGPQEVSRI